MSNIENYSVRVKLIKDAMLRLGQDIRLGYSLTEEQNLVRVNQLKEVIDCLKPVLLSFEDALKASLPPEQKKYIEVVNAECLRLINEEKNYTKAVLYYRASTGRGLREAKDSVDALKASVRKTNEQ